MKAVQCRTVSLVLLKTCSGLLKQFDLDCVESTSAMNFVVILAL